MDFALSEAQAEIHRQVAALARGFDWGYWREKDRKAEYPAEFVQAFADAGWLGLAIPAAYGGAGPDTSRIETRARRDGAGWIVSGRKVWTSNARRSQKMLLLARTAPAGAAG